MKRLILTLFLFCGVFSTASSQQSILAHQERVQYLLDGISAQTPTKSQHHRKTYQLDNYQYRMTWDTARLAWDTIYRGYMYRNDLGVGVTEYHGVSERKTAAGYEPTDSFYFRVDSTVFMQHLPNYWPNGRSIYHAQYTGFNYHAVTGTFNFIYNDELTLDSNKRPVQWTRHVDISQYDSTRTGIVLYDSTIYQHLPNGNLDYFKFYSYTGAGGPLKLLDSVDISYTNIVQPSSATIYRFETSPNLYRENYRYDGNGNRTSLEYQNWDASTSAFVTNLLNKRYYNNNLLTVDSLYFSGQDSRTTVYTYTSFNLLDSVNSYGSVSGMPVDWGVRHYYYDQMNRLDSMVILNNPDPRGPMARVRSYKVWYDYSQVSTSLNQQVIQASSVQVYPNPVKERLYIKNASNQTHISILNTRGQLVNETFLRNSEASIEVSLLPRGVYLIQTDQGKVGKFIKE